MTDKKFREDIRGQFRVAEFKPAELEVKVVPEKVNYFYGDRLHATISSNYLFGAPVKNESFSWLIRKFRFHFNPNGYDEFSFEKYSGNDGDEYGDYEYDSYPEVIVSDSGVLDGKGFANISYDLLKPLKAHSEYYQIEATVTGKSSQPISTWNNVVVHQSTSYVGIKKSDYICSENKPTRFEFVVLTPEEKRTAGKKISVTIIRRNWVSVRKTEVDGRLSWESQTKDSLVQQNVIESHESGSDTISITPPISGYYIINASIIDKSDTVSASSTSIYACGSSYSSWSRSDDDYIDVISDRKKYVPGETAHILVKSPFKTAKALLTVEREGVLLTKWITLTGSASTIDLPITSNYLPNVYVSVMIIRGRTSKQDFDHEGNDLSKPIFKIGYCKFAVEPSGKRLKVSVVPEKTEYQPGDSVKVSLHVPQLAGKNYASDVLLMAVDESVLMLSGYRTPDIFSFFYGPRPLCVLTSELRGSVIGERNYGEKGKNRGGSGGNSDIFDKLTARGNFKICAYFNPRVVLDKNGSATVSFKLPDNLSTFRLMAITQTAMSEFGSADARITVNKKLMLRPLMPRFLRMGDSCSAGVIAENYSDTTDTLKLLTQATSLHLSAGEKKQLVINKNSNAYALMPMVANAFADSISYTFKGILGKNSDAVTGKIPLIFERGIETVALSGSTVDSAHQQLQIPDNTYRQFDSLSTTLSSTALIGLGESVRYLYEYPYGCLEQRTSCVLPLILYNDMMSAFGKSTLKNNDVPYVVQEYLNMMHKFQCPNGGFDYWNPPSHDSPYLTAYAVLALLKAEQKGFKVDKNCKNSALNYLKTFLDGNHNRNKYPYSEYEWNATEAFIVAVLTEAGMYQADDVERLYTKRARMPLYGLAQLYKAVSLGNGNTQIKNDLKTMINNSAKIEAASIHFEEPENDRLSWIHSSNIHTTAAVLISILEVDKKYPQAEKVVHWLIQQQKNNRWNNTHENLYAFWALAEYFKAYEGETPDFTAKAKVDGQSWMEQQFKGRSTKQYQTEKSLSTLEPGKKVNLDFVKTGTGRLYYQMRMQYAPREGLTQRDEGFDIKREYKSVSGNSIIPPQFKVGQPVIVTLTVTTKQDMLYVAVNDPIPAGCEIIDPSLSVVSPELVDKISSVNNGESDYWWGSWNHTEYRDQRCLLFADFLNRGTHTFSYLLRPTIEGAFYTPPAHVEEMYSPEVFGRTGEYQVTIKK